MEGIGFILIGAALFSHSWYLMELYAEGRAVGVVMAAIAVGLLFALTFDAQILGTVGTSLEKTGDITVMKSLLALWAVYSFAVAAQGYFDLEEHNVRATGFFGAIMALTSLFALFYFSSVIKDRVDNMVVIAFSLAALMMALASVVLFLYLAVPLRAVKPLAGWFMMIGGVIVTIVGLAVITTMIVA